MHPPLCRVAVPSVPVPVALMLILLACAPQIRGIAQAGPPHTPFAHVEIAGSARRPSTEAQPTDQSPRVGGQPQQVTVAQAAFGEVVVEPLPNLLEEPRRQIGVNGCGAEFSGAGVLGLSSFPGEVTCGLEECASCSSGGMYPCWPIPRINWCRSEFFGGVQSFAGPANYAGVGTDPSEFRGSSSFGIHYGMSGARPLALLDNQASAQLGIRGAVSDFEGADFTDNSRRQIFVTGGFFRRVDYGLQGGVVADYLHDDWYYELHLSQLRGEISWKTAGNDEFGYGYMAGLSDDSSRTAIATGGVVVADRVEMEAVNQNRLFYRRHFRDRGFVELFAGISGDDDGLLGASLELPLDHAFTLRSGVTYLSPETSGAQRDHQEEAWNLGISLVWYPCGGCDAARYQRPLMDVADNGTFMFDRQ